MFCTRCQNPVVNCECGDIEERLEKLSQHEHMATQWCKKCDSNHARCECDAPDWTVK